MYKLITLGNFSDCLTTLNSMLPAMPFTTVDTRQEVNKLKEPPPIVRRRHSALRCELACAQVR